MWLLNLLQRKFVTKRLDEFWIKNSRKDIKLVRQVTRDPFFESPGDFSGLKAIEKTWTSRLQSCVIHIFLISTEVSFIQEVSGEYTSPFLDTDELKMTKSFRGFSEPYGHAFRGFIRAEHWTNWPFVRQKVFLLKKISSNCFTRLTKPIALQLKMSINPDVFSSSSVNKAL